MKRLQKKNKWSRQCRSVWWTFLLALPLAGCAEPRSGSPELAVAEAFLDAFYAWDSDALAALMRPGADADRMLYYQGWAEAAHYQISHRRPCEGVAEQIVCAVTVTDDFGSSLGYQATDTFTMAVTNGSITQISSEGDDPPVFEAVFGWLQENRPEVFSGPCRDMFAGGTTPGNCARAIAQGARDFAAIQEGEKTDGL